MDLGLRGDRVLITGGSRGIGLAAATSLAAEGPSAAPTTSPPSSPPSSR
jgi:NAD(P)-dependent dehydrogenase (short-subunit alcohol dehydrogenase family)